ncbi:MAG: glycosyltransferase [Longimicrobiales bacterium]
MDDDRPGQLKPHVTDSRRPTKRADIVLLSTAEWDNPFWTNKQHVACELAKRGHRVFYIESLGLRRPSVNGRDLRRILRRLRRSMRAPRHVRENVWVWSPLVLPFQGSKVARAVNRLLLRVSLSFHLRSKGIDKEILWTYNPMTTRFLDVGQWDKVVYHCVDDIAAQPGMPAEAIREADDDLTAASDVVFTTAPRLAEVRRSINARTFFLPNVVDYEHFSQAQDDATSIPADLAAIPEPRLGYVGAVSGYKLNFRLLKELAERRPDWSIVLIGQVGAGDPGTDPSLLQGLPNLHLLGPRPYGELPSYMKGFDAALLPSQLNDYTASMFPMKFFEYLAAGRPVVSVDLPAIRDFREVVSISNDAAGFEASVEGILIGKGPGCEAGQMIARTHTYEVRTEKMMKLLEGVPEEATTSVHTGPSASTPPPRVGASAP